MKSGLEGRNNLIGSAEPLEEHVDVSMKSGLEGRNNVLFADFLPEDGVSQ